MDFVCAIIDFRIKTSSTGCCARMTKAKKDPNVRIKILVYSLCVLCSSGICYSQMLMGEGTSKPNSIIQIGSLEILWSKANSHYGYIYGVEGLSFAGISSGPSNWGNKHLYKSYQGFNNIEEINQNPNLTFSSSPTLVFSTASDPSIPDHRGILLFRYQDMLGGIDFIRIDENGLYYKYWINIQEDDEASTSQSSDSESIVYTEGVHEYHLHQQFDTLEITGDSQAIFHSGLTITQSLKITEGSLIINGKEPLYVNNIEIGKNGRLVVQEGSTIFVAGDWTNNNSEFVQTESVVFNGPEPQKISGFTQFNSLEIDTDSIVESSTISAHVLSIHSGIFSPGEDSIFTHVFIADTGILCPVWQTSIFVQGDLINEGKFYHNGGTVIMNGSDRQDIDMGGASFFNLVIPEQNVFFRSPPVAESQIRVEDGG
jgi:hypothetical protein